MVIDELFGTYKKLYIEVENDEAISFYKSAVKTLKRYDENSKLGISLDLNGDVEKVVLTGYTDVELLKIGLIVGTLDGKDR